MLKGALPAAILTIIAVAVILLILIVRAKAEPCYEKPGIPVAGKWWHWRMIEGRKCWYVSRRALEKSRLMWPQPEPDKPETDGGPDKAAYRGTVNPPGRPTEFELRWADPIEFMPTRIWSDPIPLLEWR